MSATNFASFSASLPKILIIPVMGTPSCPTLALMSSSVYSDGPFFVAVGDLLVSDHPALTFEQDLRARAPLAGLLAREPLGDTCLESRWDFRLPFDRSLISPSLPEAAPPSFLRVDVLSLINALRGPPS